MAIGHTFDTNSKETSLTAARYCPRPFLQAEMTHTVWTSATSLFGGSCQLFLQLGRRHGEFIYRCGHQERIIATEIGRDRSELPDEQFRPKGEKREDEENDAGDDDPASVVSVGDGEKGGCDVCVARHGRGRQNNDKKVGLKGM